jgi:hypothetical protein
MAAPPWLPNCQTALRGRHSVQRLVGRSWHSGDARVSVHACPPTIQEANAHWDENNTRELQKVLQRWRDGYRKHPPQPTRGIGQGESLVGQVALQRIQTDRQQSDREAQEQYAKQTASNSARHIVDHPSNLLPRPHVIKTAEVSDPPNDPIYIGYPVLFTGGEEPSGPARRSPR